MADEAKLEGFAELQLALRHLETELPKNTLRKAVQGGADKVLQAARSAAPELTGALKSGLKLHKERNYTMRKVVYDVYPDPAKNDIFQKPVRNPINCESEHAYYPASQEYGYPTRAVRKWKHGRSPAYARSNMKMVPGKHYMLTGAELAGEAAKQSIVDDILNAIYEEFGD